MPTYLDCRTAQESEARRYWLRKKKSKICVDFSSWRGLYIDAMEAILLMWHKDQQVYV